MFGIHLISLLFYDNAETCSGNDDNKKEITKFNVVTRYKVLYSIFIIISKEVILKNSCFKFFLVN